jgi:hypothetical protein
MSKVSDFNTKGHANFNVCSVVVSLVRGYKRNMTVISLLQKLYAIFLHV